MFGTDCKGPLSLTQDRGYKIEAVFLMVAPLALRGFVGVDVPQPSNAPAKSRCHAGRHLLHTMARVVVRIASGEVIWCPMGKKNTLPLLGFVKEGGRMFCRRKAKDEKKDASGGKDCALDPLFHFRGLYT